MQTTIERLTSPGGAETSDRRASARSQRPGRGSAAPRRDETLSLQHADEFDLVYKGYLALEAAGRTVDTRFVSV